MILIDPITREEILLAKALGENVPDIVPIIRKEMYLAKIAGADIQTPEAITREEMYLDAIANGTEVSIEPITRKEMFYAKALGLIENAPEPITRIENLLNQITAVGGGGGQGFPQQGAGFLHDHPVSQLRDACGRAGGHQYPGHRHRASFPAGAG